MVQKKLTCIIWRPNQIAKNVIPFYDATMRMFLLTIVALGIGGAIMFVFLQEQKKVGKQAQSATEAVQEKADAYRKAQEDMMKKLEQ